MGTQRVRLSDPIDTDDEPETAGAAGRNAGERVLEHRRFTGATPSARAPARNVSGAGLPLRCSRFATYPSIRTSKRSSIPAAMSTS